MQGKPSHYFVIRSPYAQLVLTGVKTFEWRTNAKMFANKRLAVAVSKSRAHEDDLQNDIATYDGLLGVPILEFKHNLFQQLVFPN